MKLTIVIILLLVPLLLLPGCGQAAASVVPSNAPVVAASDEAASNTASTQADDAKTTHNPATEAAGETPSNPVAPTVNLAIYDDALQNGLQDWSWAPVNLAAPAPVFEGVASVEVSYATNYDGVWFVNSGAGIPVANYSALHFAIHGGTTGGQQLRVGAGDTQIFPGDHEVELIDYLAGGPVANAWREVTIPLDDFTIPSGTLLTVAFQSDVGGSQPTLYIDDVYLVGNTTPPPATVSVTIESTGVITTVNPLILGSNLPTWLGPARLQNPTFIARTAASGVTILRLPGGSYSNNYHWLACETGDTANCMVDTWGATPTDFIEFMQATHTQGMWVVSPNGTPEEAAALVAFFNAEVGDTTVIGTDANGFDWGMAGQWAQLRTDHGNPDPFPLQYWEFGNEIYGGKPQFHPQCASYGWEDVWTCDGTEYVNGIAGHPGYLAFRDAMKAVDPTIEVGAVGIPHPGEWTNWGNEVIAAAGQDLDFYALHEYAFDASPAYSAALMDPHPNWTGIRNDLQTAIDTNGGGRNIPLAVTEYNLISVGDQDNGTVMIRAVNALFIADTIGQMITKGFFLANQWDLANGEFGNGSDYGLLNDDTANRYPQYYIFPLWSQFGGQMVSATADVSPDTTLSVYGGVVDGNTYSLLAINKTGTPLESTIAIAGATITGGLANVVQGESLEATTVTYNGVATPADDLSDAPAAPITVSGAAIPYTFAPYSVTLLHLEITGGTPIPTVTPTPDTGPSPTPWTPTGFLYLPLAQR